MTKFKKYSAAEKKALGLDKFPDTMFDMSMVRDHGSRYPEYEPVKPKELEFEDD